MTERSDWQFKASSSYGCAPRSQNLLQPSYALLNSLIIGVGTDPVPLLGDKDDAWIDAPTTGWKIIYKS